MGAAGIYAAAQVGAGSPWLVAVAFSFGVVFSVCTALRDGRLWTAVVAHLCWTPAVLGLVPCIPALARSGG